MNKEQLNKITGFLAIGLLFGLFFLMSWLFSRTNQKIEGPHIFYSGDTLTSLTINITGNKQDKTYKIIQNSKEDITTFKMQVPHDKSITFQKHESIEIPQDYYDAPKSTFVISDIEGDFDFLRAILQGNNVIDEHYNWTYGRGHLVVVGDIFDRGKYVTECLWLLYKLENEAKNSGGQVHLILGNHEIMALQGDHRYIDRKYKRITRALKMEYNELYGTNTEVGRWLRTKNTAEVIGKTLFVHGGISSQIINHNISINEINTVVRKNINTIASKQDSTSILVMGNMGPLWYRGYVEEPIPELEVQEILDYYDVHEIAVGHTVVNKITSLYNNKVYALDAKRKQQTYTALLIEDNKHYVVTDKGQKTEL